jgi:hypothetical protein
MLCHDLYCVNAIAVAQECSPVDSALHFFFRFSNISEFLMKSVLSFLDKGSRLNAVGTGSKPKQCR